MFSGADMKIINRRALLSALVQIGPFLTATLCLLLSVSPARCEEDDLQSLELYNGASVEMVSAGRSPRPASQTAENITVVTASEIAALNAHTLSDVLFTIPGVQLQMLRTPGTVTNVEIQGSLFSHILVLIDNVPLNNLADNFPDISSVPVQMIERIEIIKGAASSSWGSALGGVINVITKSPQTERPFGGLVSASLGNRATADARGELSGTSNGFGYYLAGGKLRSDGLQPNNMVDLNHFYGKLRYDLPTRGSLVLTTGIVDSSSGQLAVPSTANINQDLRQHISTLNAEYPVSDSLSIDAALRTKQYTAQIDTRNPAGDSLLKAVKDEESDTGASLKVNWHDELQRIVSGVDYDHVKAHLSLPLRQADALKNSADRVGVFLNDTFTLGGFALTPSARFDHTGSGGDLFSPSFGITYALTENSVLRGYTAKGYSLVSLSRDDSTEKVWTSQVGFESAEIPYLWLKGTLFRNDTWNVDAAELSGVIFKQRQLKQGYELEGRTLPYLGASLSLGYTFIDARDGDSGRVINDIPRHTLNLGLRYENKRYLRALLTGHYIDWNGTDQGGRYGAMIWDLHLGKHIEYSEHGSVELFLSVRNIFNGEQELIGAYKNPGRWLDGGVRWEF
jgi:vitamin B12 transporter